MILLHRYRVYGVLLCWIWIHTARSDDPEHEEESSNSNPWPFFAAAAIHASISIGGLVELWNDPIPTPKRLPPDVKPISYDLKFLPDYQKHVSIGHESLLVEVFHNTSNITLHAKDLILTTSTVSVTKESTGEVMVITGIEDEAYNQWIIIQLQSELHQGELIRLNINFTGLIKSSMHGIMLHNYDDIDQRRIILTHFEPYGARYAFPCFDEPSFKARFTISVATPPGMHTLSNMPLRDASEPVIDYPGWIWSHFQESVPMSTYLVAFVVSDFVGIHGDRNFSVWVQPGKEAEASLMVQYGPLLLTELEDITGIPFMLPKLDNIAIPYMDSMASVQGTENWGLITYTDTNIIIDEKESVWRKRKLVHILAHELAHNWFGNLVTPQFWDELWLKEGFAGYMQHYTTSKVLPNWEMENDFQTDVVHRSLFSKDLTVLNNKVGLDSEMMSKYNLRTYYTGSVLIQMMEHILTRDVFIAGVRSYLKTYSYQAASSHEFFEALDAAAANTSSHGLPPGIGMEEVMRPWLWQSRHPLITVIRDYTSGNITVCQKDVTGEGQRWWVPLSYTTQSEQDFNRTVPRLWLSPNESCTTMTGVATAEEWILFNVRQTGYYQVNYDQQNWQLLADYLNSDNFSTISISNRMQMLNDILNLAVDETIALNLTSYLKRETNPFPWIIAIEASMLRKDTSKDYLLKLSKSFYSLIQGLPLDILSRDAPQAWEKALYIACDYSVSPDCIQDAYNHLRVFQANTSNYSVDSMPRGLQHIIFCSALENKQSKKEDILFLWNRAKKLKDRRYFIIQLKWCFRHSEMIQSVMEILVTDSYWLTTEERQQVIWPLCSQDVSADALAQVLKILKDEQVGSAPSPDLYLLHTATSTINSIPIVKMHISKLWCLLTLSWLTVTPFDLIVPSHR